MSLATKRDPETENMGSEEASAILDNRLSFAKIQDWRFVGEVDTRIRSDWKVPLITGCCAMAKGIVVLCDQGNSKIKLLNEISEIKSDIPCEYSPFDVAPVDEDKAVVSFPQRRSLQFIRVRPGLKLEGHIRTNYECYGVAVYENDIFVCIDETNSNSRVLGIQILSQNGKMIKFITHHGAGSPRYLCLSNNSSCIFYSSPVNNDSQYPPMKGQSARDAFVLCVTKEEHVLYRYLDDKLDNPGSLVGDDLGNLLICDQQFCSVHIVKPSGSHDKTLHFTHPGYYHLNPTSMCYNRNDDLLLVAVTVGSPPFLPRPMVQLNRLSWTEDKSKLLLLKLQPEKRSWWSQWYPGVTLQWSGVFICIVTGLLFSRVFLKTSSLHIVKEAR